MAGESSSESTQTCSSSRESAQRNMAVEEERKIMESSPQDQSVHAEINQGGDGVELDDQLRSAKSQMGEVREENERLKQLLSKIVKDYQSLQTHFFQALPKKSTEEEADQIEEPEVLVSLSLGRSSSSTLQKKSSKEIKEGLDQKMNEGQLSLGLDCRVEQDSSSLNVKNNPISTSHEETSFEEQINKEDEATQTWPPSKVLKTVRNAADDEVSQQPPLKKPRVSVRARCDTPTMNDGCQWRKYGQKIAKGNPCPRAYYRCTISPTCPVRKQVQRCAEDMSVLTTTYEGTHNHPLPLAATSMASTTSAAASMLLSRSSQSSSPSIATGSTASTSSGIFSFRPHENLTHFQNSSISISNSHPTITLDLTNSYNSAASTRSFPSAPIRYPSSSSNAYTLNFSSCNSPWNSAIGNYYSLPSHSMGNRQQYGSYQPPPANIQMMGNRINTPPPSRQDLVMSESIAAAATKVASNPSFRSALAAAISSYVGNIGGAAEAVSLKAAEHSTGLNLKLGD